MRRAALERHPGLQERVPADSFEKLQEAENLLERLGPKPGRFGFALKVGRAQHQRTSAQDRVNTRSGTIRFQLFTSLPGSRRESR